MSDSDPYSPPEALIQVDAVECFPNLRFWIACAVCAPVGILLMFVFSGVSTEIPDWLIAALVAVVWLLPVGWILLPELKMARGFNRLSLGRFISVSVGWFLGTAFLMIIIMLLIGVALLLLDLAR